MRRLLTVAVAPFYAFGWFAAVLCSALALVPAAVRVGWQEGRARAVAR